MPLWRWFGSCVHNVCPHLSHNKTCQNRVCRTSASHWDCPGFWSTYLTFWSNGVPVRLDTIPYNWSTLTFRCIISILELAPVGDPWAHHDWWLSAPWHQVGLPPRFGLWIQVEDPPEIAGWWVSSNSSSSSSSSSIQIYFKHIQNDISWSTMFDIWLYAVQHNFIVQIYTVFHTLSTPDKWIGCWPFWSQKIELYKLSSRKECILFFVCQTSGTSKHQRSDISGYCFSPLRLSARGMLLRLECSSPQSEPHHQSRFSDVLHMTHILCIAYASVCVGWICQGRMLGCLRITFFMLAKGIVLCNLNYYYYNLLLIVFVYCIYYHYC